MCDPDLIGLDVDAPPGELREVRELLTADREDAVGGMDRDRGDADARLHPTVLRSSRRTVRPRQRQT